MNSVILQPSYIPWRGYFHQIQKADIFVFFDDVQYDARGWRNRNRVKTPQGSIWLTIPICSKGLRSQALPINEIRIDWTKDWSGKHLETLRHVYGKTPFFACYEEDLTEMYRERCELLADFTIKLTIFLSDKLKLAPTRFMRSSELAVTGNKTDRLLNILQTINTTHYISGPSARDYIEEDKFRDAGINLEYMSYEYPEYPQLYPPFDPTVSILDLLFMCGPDSMRYITGETCAEK
jgi:hypothetical protein